MNGRQPRRGVFLFLLMMALAAGASADRKEQRRIAGTVTYVSSGNFYIDVGRTQALAVGDTVTVTRKSQIQGSAVIIAISSSSSSARMVPPSTSAAVGDSIFLVKEITIEDQPLPAAAAAQDLPRVSSRSDANQVGGRVALQYVSAGEWGKPQEFSQPALVTRLEIQRLFGSATTFTFYGRAYYDASALYGLYGQGSRQKLRMYELSFINDNARSWYGYGFGRIMSRFVGGLGTFDGGQVFVRRGNFTAGVLAGAQADYTTSTFNPDQTKFAAFMNYAWGGDVFKTSDVTLAYGQQRYMGKLDRAFAYLQSSLRLGTQLFFYTSAEVDFAKEENGVREKGLNLTNTFVTVSYMPTSWLSINGGYDAARNIYLFESMKSIADTLLDRTLKEGFRTSVSFRLPLNVTLTGNANFRLPSGTTPSARTLGSSIRVFDIYESGINAGAQYSNIRGLYTEGTDWTFDVDRWIAQALSLTLRFDRYQYHLAGQDEKLVTTTATGSLNVRISRATYAALNFDQVWDVSRSLQRLYVEFGVHF